MDRSKRIREDRPGTKPGQNPLGRSLPARPVTLALSLLASMLVLAACASTAAPAPMLTDLLDAPVDLAGICKGEATLLLVCDPGMATCREGAVYFDSKADMIKDGGARPVMVLIGSPPAIREIVLNLDISVPVFIDPSESVFGTILDQRILPALVLLAAGGNVIEVVYGGGDSLDGNIRTLVSTRKEEGGGFNWWLLAVPVAAALLILPFVLD